MEKLLLPFHFCFCLEFEMVQMEEGIITNKENDTKEVNSVAAVAISNKTLDAIIPDEEIQPEIHLPQDQSSELNEGIPTMAESENICGQIISDIIEDITTPEDNSEAFCQSILLDILEKIEIRQPSPDHEVVPDNQITNINQSAADEILLIYEEEIILDQVPLMQENIVPEGE